MVPGCSRVAGPADPRPGSPWPAAGPLYPVGRLSSGRGRTGQHDAGRPHVVQFALGGSAGRMGVGEQAGDQVPEVPQFLPGRPEQFPHDRLLRAKQPGRAGHPAECGRGLIGGRADFPRGQADGPAAASETAPLSVME